MNPSALAYALVDQLPGVRVAQRPVSARLRKLIEENFSAVFSELATYLPHDEAPVFTRPDEPAREPLQDSSTYSFSQHQLDVIAQTFARLQKLQAENVGRERDALQVERDALQVERDALYHEINAMRASRSWRYTRGLRAGLSAWRRSR